MKQIAIIVFFITLASCQKEQPMESKIKEDVTYLADDKLEGRKTGTEGEKMAAEYIANRFKDLGLNGKGTDGRGRARRRAACSGRCACPRAGS